MRQGAAERRSSRNGRIVLVFLVACVVLLVIGPRVEPVAGVFSPVFVPIQSVVSGVADDVGATISSLTNLPGLERQNQSLRRQNALLEQRLARYPFYRREDAAFAHELNFADLNPRLDIQPARVIGYSTLGLSNSVTVGVGSNEGVRLGNPVLDPDGFVIGKVTGVLRSAATVGLLTQGNINIPAADSRTGARGLVGTPSGQSPQLYGVETGQKLRRGDLVVTSGLGNEFPIGSLIGQITAVSGGNAQSFQRAMIRTAADVNTPQYVQIIRNFGPGATVSYRPGPGNGRGAR